MLLFTHASSCTGFINYQFSSSKYSTSCIEFRSSTDVKIFGMSNLLANIFPFLFVFFCTNDLINIS